MRSLRHLLCLLFIATFASISNAQVYTESDIEYLINRTEYDSITRIERLAALEFHQLINDYRSSKNIEKLVWDESMWVATINHNSWMADANQLSHTQTTNSKYSTGKSPSDRFKYATKGNAHYYSAGENALYNYSAQGNSIEAIATNIAQTSFRQWKNSPGHNKNMLHTSYATHGVAFKVTNGRVWGTDLFTSSKRANQTEKKTPVYAKVKKKPVRKLNIYKTRSGMLDEIYAQLSETFGFKRMRKSRKDATASRKARNLLTKKYPTKSKDGVLLSKRKTTATTSLLGLFKKEKRTYSLVLEKELIGFNAEAVTGQMLNLFLKEQKFKRNSKMDIGIALKKSKGTVRITLVSVLASTKSKMYVF